jgi:hypothetical protein
LDFVHRLNYKIVKLQRFGSWILLPSSGKKGGKRIQSLSVGPLVELASDLVQVDGQVQKNIFTCYERTLIITIPEYNNHVIHKMGTADETHLGDQFSATYAYEIKHYAVVTGVTNL